jgi:hypothetical protein
MQFIFFIEIMIYKSLYEVEKKIKKKIYKNYNMIEFFSLPLIEQNHFMKMQKIRHCTLKSGNSDSLLRISLKISSPFYSKHLESKSLDLGVKE